MTDVWANVSKLEGRVQEQLAAVLESRARDPKQQAMRRAFLAEIPFPAADARVLDIGCGTGVLTRVLASMPQVRAVVGVDLSSSLLERARAGSAGLSTPTFHQADARRLPFEDRSFDIATFDSTLSHVPEPERAIEEAFRILRTQGILAVFDGDYATTTVALGDHDPLQACVDAMVENSVTDRRIMRRLGAMVANCGFVVLSVGSHGFAETSSDGYMLSIVDRGADILASLGQIAENTAAALKQEARTRLESGKFYGHIAYGSLVARKP
jgi:ubiquinone/menaquinone biosynthesis C-methylase UbiE